MALRNEFEAMLRLIISPNRGRILSAVALGWFCAFQVACQNEPASPSLIGSWRVEAWSWELLPSTEYLDASDTGASRDLLTEATMEVTGDRMVVELSTDVIEDWSTGSRHTVTRTRFVGAIEDTSPGHYDVHMLEDGESRGFLMVCTAQTASLLVCDIRMGSTRLPCVFHRLEAP